MLESVMLEPEQQELLLAVVEASRNVQRDNRQKFHAIQTLGSNLARLAHPGLPVGFPGVYMGDIQILANQRLLSASFGSHGTISFDVAPLGFRYYEELRRSREGPVDRLETAIHSYLDSNDFRSKFPEAFDKWADAENRLWAGDSERDLTTIGHAARESLQLFTTALVEMHKPADHDRDVSHTVSRLRSVLASTTFGAGDRERAFLEALVAYWGTVSDLVQRQEHGGQKEGSPLIWEDARRVVFQAAIVMFELDRAIRRNR